MQYHQSTFTRNKSANASSWRQEYEARRAARDAQVDADPAYISRTVAAVRRWQAELAASTLWGAVREALWAGMMPRIASSAKALPIVLR